MKKILLTMIMLSGLSAFSVEKPKFEIGISWICIWINPKNGVAPAIFWC